MGFSFRNRINLGKGFGLNISKSGISPSMRTRFGSVSGKGFSVRTGIAGVNYRSSFRKSSGCLVFIIVFFSMLFSIITTILN